ncbi:MAG: hypothetical protein F2659_05185 [Actinobacteria bacterium]|uniref:Unannotated protein n=1 Tax=freshwater metagenome TaxID=449393 RepID=A0A6J6PED2_9ZZZZ|nr:hypothetical protein [Actinomycetota bacterium]
MNTDLNTRLTVALKDAADTVPIADDAFATIATRASSSRPNRARWVKLAGATAVVAAIAIGVGIVRDHDSDTVYAGWTPTSRVGTPAETGAIVDVCNARTGDSNGDLPSDAFNTNSHVELRGRIALVLQRSSDGSRYYTCTAEQQNDGWYAFTLGAKNAVGNGEPFLEGGGGPGNFTSVLYGQSATAVSVELDVPGLPTATAPVVDGLYAIWWPADSQPAEQGLPTLEVRLLDQDGLVIDTINW